MSNPNVLRPSSQEAEFSNQLAQYYETVRQALEARVEEGILTAEYCENGTAYIELDAGGREHIVAVFNPTSGVVVYPGDYVSFPTGHNTGKRGDLFISPVMPYIIVKPPCPRGREEESKIIAFAVQPDLYSYFDEVWFRRSNLNRLSPDIRNLSAEYHVQDQMKKEL